MKKALPLVFIIVVIIITASVVIGIKHSKTVDWEESFDERSNKPYGTSIFYKELPRLFKNQKVRTVFHQPASYLSANSENGFGEHVAKGSYIIIGNSEYLEQESVNELLSFVDRGNTLFLSDYSFNQKFNDTLGFDTKYIKNEKDSLSYLSFSFLDINETVIDKNAGDYYFTNFNTSNSKVLGHSKIDYKHVNFLEFGFGKGKIYLHLEPKAFTNYNILKANRYTYVEGVLSYLPENDVYYDSYIKIRTGYDGDVEQESNLSWFLDQIAFSWAWYTAIIFGVLFLIFNAKRRQRIIKIIKPLQNTTVAFVKTISNLYFETKDHKNLIDKKTTYFLEKTRADFNIDTTILNEEFVSKLVSKTGKKKDVVKKTIDYINLLQSKNELNENHLITLNKHIEAFYSN